jgi:hypothetical protein
MTGMYVFSKLQWTTADMYYQNCTMDNDKHVFSKQYNGQRQAFIFKTVQWTTADMYSQDCTKDISRHVFSRL